VIDRGLRADGAEADLRRIAPARGQQATAGGRGERHRILVARGDRHLRHAQPQPVLVGGDAARDGEVVEVDVAARERERDRVDADALAHGREVSTLLARDARIEYGSRPD
jgi:hypothetical protein